jgi:putative hydrolase of the HAD superfamily
MRGSSALIQAVTFDYWGTLVWEDGGMLRGRRVDLWMERLARAGFVVDRDAMAAAVDASWATYVGRWESNTQYGGWDALGDILQALRLDPPADVRAAMFDAFASAHRGAHLRVADGLASCLAALKACGVAVGIVCDVGMTPSTALLEILDERGLLRHFDHWSFSDEVGWYKPARQIFEHALAGLGGVDPARAAHVGDRLRTDVAGALGMGMVAVRYTGAFDDRAEGFAEAHHVLASHADLPAALGLS